jgi:predicted nucleic acid-binding Zn ribbon protein
MTSRNGYVTNRCCVCGDPLPAGRPRTTCSDACRQAKWRRFHQPQPAPPELPAAHPRKPHTLYECPECTTRQIGVQFCEDCRTFMRRVGFGGTCPCCGEAIAFDELADT